MSALELKVESAKEDKKLNELAESTEKVTEEKIEKSLNYDELTDEEKKAVDEFNEKIDVFDSTQVLQFGAAAQNKISGFSDSVLEDVKTKNTGEVGDLLAKLVGEIKSFDGAIGEPKGLGKIFHSAKREFNTIKAKYSKVETNIDGIEKSLDKSKIGLLKDVSMFDEMYQKNLEYFKEISLYIIAGEKKLDELRNVTLPELKKKAEESKEQVDIQKVQDMEAQINRFEKKIYDLKTTRIISIQMAPQIRLIQNNDAELVDKIQMMKDIEIFDQMYDKNLEYFKELSLYIIAGMKKIDELKTKVLPELEKTAKESGEETDVQKVNDMNNLINRFEKKIYDLKTTRIISIQMAPQIRLIQNNDAELVDKITSSITNTIPLWKNQMVIALGISNAKQALNAQKKVSELTNEMLKKNSETLKQGSIDIAKESERAIVDLETLKKTNSDLITTLDEIVKIHAEGRKQREEAEIELNKIEVELKDKLMNLKEENA